MVCNLKECKKFGLVWEDKPEQVVIDCQTKLPVLSEVPAQSITTSADAPTNIIIEGDNYHALSVLNYTHAGKIDLIYIDPPYNTGNKDFIYNDRIVDAEDGYRHSKWLSFMEKRLRLAKNLLSDTGVIFISIDDNEQARLKLLCDEVFGIDNFYGELIQLKGNTQNDSKTIQRNHEYILVYCKQKADLLLTYTNDVKKEVFEDEFYLGRDTGASSGHDKLLERPKLGYTIYYYEQAINGATGNHNKLLERPKLGYTIYYYEQAINGATGNHNKLLERPKLGYTIYPGFKIFDNGKKIIHAIAVPDYSTDNLKPDSTEQDVYKDVQELLDLGYVKIRPPKRKGGKLGRWTWSLSNFKELWNNNQVLIKNAKNVIKKEFVDAASVIELNGKKYYVKTNRLPIQSIIEITNSAGSSILSGNNGVLPGCTFTNPKNPELIKLFMRAYPNKNLTILDFFAGSGTTGHAVLELNAEDGGNRQFILCTNNENNIARDITYPRIKTVITGVRPNGTKYSDGVPGNVRYFKTDFIDRDKSNDRLREKIAPLCTDMIKIRENCFETISDTAQLKVFKNNNEFVALVFDEYELAPYISELEKLKTDKPIKLYVFSYDSNARTYEMPAKTKHKYINSPIPDGVLAVYRRIFNTKDA
ncbi:MAG: site-specific DNA-methyltransferase [Muribaculaceae bacterium]|nr:site-specific DNA-methyltransferase [Muribaculaceae bacterium]